MDPEERRHVRAIVRQVHPDLFSAHPYERAKNSEALKVRRSLHTRLRVQGGQQRLPPSATSRHSAARC